MNSSPADRGEFARHWTLLLAAVAGIALGPAAVAITYTLGALTPALIAAFGWSRAELLLVGPFLLVGAVLGTQAMGWLLDRLEPRKVIVASQVGFGLCFLALALFVHGLPSFWALYFILGLVGAGASPLSFVKVLSAAFVRHRGLAIGLALAGTGLSGMFAPTFVTALVAQGGWRLGYAGVGALVLLVAVPLSWLLLPRRPARAVEADAGPAPAGASLTEAIRSPRMWTLAIAFMLAAGAVTALIASLVPLLTEAGHSAAEAAAWAGTIGVAVIVGRIAVGWLVDRVWAPAVGAVVIGAAAGGTWLLGVPGLPAPVVIGAIFVIGLATGAEFDLNAFLTARYFGTRHLGRIYAVQYSALITGSGLAAPLAGWMRDQSADYRPMLWAVAAAFAACAGLLLTLGRYPDFTSPPDRRRPE